MSEPIKAPNATLDWYAPRIALRQRVAEVAVETFERAGFRQIVTPVFEETRLFARTSGESSDVVQKEMYSFRDRSDRELTLRPEGTAPVVRAYLEHGLAREPQPVKLWYFTPMYRYARAQRGRYREHWQFGVEVLGSDDPAVDAEIIALQHAWYEALGLQGVVLKLNSIGDHTCRPAYRERLIAWMRTRADALSEESMARLELNPMRVFDSKDAGDQQAIAGGPGAEAAPLITDHLCDGCRTHFAAVCSLLDARGVSYELDPGLVRGLDYYERTAWEFVRADLGGQSAISGGGRYDGLAEQIGGRRVPGVGFGCGSERIVLTLEDQGVEIDDRTTQWFCAIDEPAAVPALHAALDRARALGIACEADLMGRSLKGQLKHAERLRATVVTVCTPDSWARGSVRIGEQEVAVAGLENEIGRRIA